MKRNTLLLLFVSIFFSAFAQTNMYWFNPFSFQPNILPQMGVVEQIATDTSGQMWFSAYNGYTFDTHIINESGTIDYILSNSNIYTESFFFDSRNTLWSTINGSYYKGNTFTPFVLPGVLGSYGYSSQITSDQIGNDYFITYHSDTSAIDSIFVTKYDGSVFQNIYTDTLNIINDTTGLVPYGFCDNSGALILYLPSRGFIKYYQGVWNPMNIVLSPYATPLLIDKNNNLYFLGDSVFLIKVNGNTLDTIAPPATILNLYYSNYSFTLGPDSNLWMLTGYNGFYDLNPNGAWTYVPSPGFMPWYTSSYTDGNFYPAIFDKKGRMWTTGGTNLPPYTIGVYSFTPFNSISGRVFYDSSGTGIPTSSDPGFTAMNIVQATNGYYANTDSNGDYQVIYLDSAIGHVVSATPPQYYHLTTPSSYTVGPGDSLCCFNFGVQANGNIQDLQITAASFCANPGYTSLTWLNYQNTGAVTVSDTITYVYDSLLHYYGASPSPTIISGHTLSWAYQDLAPFQTGTIAIGFLLDSNATIGDTLISVATIQPLSTDTTPGNNVYVNTQVTTSSFDPNSKTVSPSSGIMPGQELTYTIYFQNTGTAPAVNIVVLDTLDPNINPATFRVLGSSSPVKVSLEGPGVLSFTFSNINLPDSSGAGSTGFVQFSVSIANPLNHSATSISNAAYINFDFNQPVQTNTAISTFSPNAGIAQTKISSGIMFKLLPNPANNEVMVQTNETSLGGTLIVYDAIGRQIVSTAIEKDKMFLNLQQFASGVYLFQIISKDGKTESSKLVKQ